MKDEIIHLLILKQFYFKLEFKMKINLLVVIILLELLLIDNLLMMMV
jgi:hypothetical protein